MKTTASEASVSERTKAIAELLAELQLALSGIPNVNCGACGSVAYHVWRHLIDMGVDATIHGACDALEYCAELVPFNDWNGHVFLSVCLGGERWVFDAYTFEPDVGQLPSFDDNEMVRLPDPLDPATVREGLKRRWDWNWGYNGRNVGDIKRTVRAAFASA